MDLEALKKDFLLAADPARARLLARFFKTGKGEYAEGDKFLGLTVPATRTLAKKYAVLPLKAVQELLSSPWHEHRLCALLLLCEKFRAAPEVRKAVFELYLRNTRRINNWDLVDVSAPRVVGGWLLDKSRAPLYRLAASTLLWERRIAMLACFTFICEGDAADALKIARLLLGDRHDLMHKAVGWMLREVGKRCSERELLAFLRANYARLPRTALRYAIERFPERKRKRLLAGDFR
ncbi:MAG: DNA alkylation repair protein [Elusimicrobia bacterium GWC2_64_44]|nr:MAG: DNA alkylation repair protein [Elusimicrobia bacterium GWC2_64_44]